MKPQGRKIHEICYKLWSVQNCPRQYWMATRSPNRIFTFSEVQFFFTPIYTYNSYHTSKHVFFWGGERQTGKIFIRVTSYHPRHIHSTPFILIRLWSSSFQESLCSYILYSWVLSKLPMDGQSPKALDPSLSVEDLENRDAEYLLEKILGASGFGSR